MLKVKVNGKWEFEADPDKGKLDGKEFSWDIIEVRENTFHIIRNNKTYMAEVLEANHTEKKFVIRINGTRYEMQARDRYDELLHKLGMDEVGSFWHDCAAL